MAFDSYDMLYCPDGDIRCRRCLPDHTDEKYRPIFDLDEVDEIPRCVACKQLGEYFAFGPTAVDYYADQFGQWLILPGLGCHECAGQLTLFGPGHNHDIRETFQLDELDAAAEHLRWCIEDEWQDDLRDAFVLARADQLARELAELTRLQGAPV